MSSTVVNNDRVQLRYFLFLRLTRKFLSRLKLKDSVHISPDKLYKAVNFYFQYSDMAKKEVGCGNTNDTKKCAFTLYALNKYRPFSAEGNNEIVSSLLLNINEYISLYLSFNYFNQKSFRSLFMLNENMVYLLENYALIPEQFMIMLDIHYADYNNIQGVK